MCNIKGISDCMLPGCVSQDVVGPKTEQRPKFKPTYLKWIDRYRVLCQQRIYSYLPEIHEFWQQDACRPHSAHLKMGLDWILRINNQIIRARPGRIVK